MEAIWKTLIKDAHIAGRSWKGEKPPEVKAIHLMILSGFLNAKKGKWYEELLYFFSQEGEDKVIELTSKYYPTIWDEKKCIAYLCRECKTIIIDI